MRGLFVAGICFAALSAQLFAQPRPTESLRRSAEALRSSLESLEPDFSERLKQLEERREILTAVDAAIITIESSPPSRKTLEDALAALRSAESRASHISGAQTLRELLGLAVDRIRTELLNPGSYQPEALADYLHHSVAHPSAGFYRQGVTESDELWQQIVRFRQGLMQLAGGFSFNRIASPNLATPGSQELPIPALRFRYGDRSHELSRSMSAYHSEARGLQVKWRVHSEISDLVHRASRDLSTFQNSIGLQDAQDRVTEALKIAADAAWVDPEMKAALDWAAERFRVALLSPSSTDMEAIREEVHHLLLHPSDLALMRIERDAREQVAFLATLDRSLARIADQLAAAGLSADRFLTPTSRAPKRQSM